MRSFLLGTTLMITLPFMAGFSYAQNYQGDSMAPTGMAVSGATTPATPTDMTRSAQLERQLRDLTNQIEQRDFQIRQLQQAFDRYVADTSQRLDALERGAAASAQAPIQQTTGTAQQADITGDPALDAAAPPMPETVTSTQIRDPNQGSTMDDPNAPFRNGVDDAGQGNRQLGQISQSEKSAPRDTVTSGTPQRVTAAQAYDRAFAYLQQGNYSDAETAFQDFLKNYPKHPLTGNAQYWLGETYFAQTQYSQAARIFARAFQEYPSGQKAPDSLLKLAASLEKMNKKQDACLTLTELQKRFKSGPAAITRRATEEQGRMGCGA